MASDSQDVSGGPPARDITTLFIHRPVLAWVLNIILILVGVVTYFQLSVRQYPQIEQPVITVYTQFEGAGPEIVESQVTRQIEQALAGLEGLDYTYSVSEAEQSRVKLYFQSSRPIDAAAADIRDRLSRLDKLPKEAHDPRIRKADIDAEPVLNVVLFSSHHPVDKLNDYATRYIQNELESTQGVAAVDLMGGGSYEMHIVLDPVRMAAYKLTATEVAEALHQQNIKKPAGRLTGHEREFLVTTTAKLSKPDQFNRLVLAEKDGYVVRLSDVGQASIQSDESRFKIRYNGQLAVLMGVSAQSRANPIQISGTIQEKLKSIRSALPSGMSIDIASDNSFFIEESIKHVYQSIWEAILLVILVIFVFLRSLRASLVPLITIPISLIGACFVMYLFGFTLNTLTLLALVLAIGLVVDDAIVVLENIYRYVEEGMPPMRAAIKGAREIQFPVIAMTLTLAAVYTPIALSTGMTGKLFTEFALTLTGAVLISGFVALVLSPMMCSRLLVPHNFQVKEGQGPLRAFFIRFDRWVEGALSKLDLIYQETLLRILNYRLYVLGAGAGIGLLGYVLANFFVPSELTPPEDQGVLKVIAQAPFGATLDYLDRSTLEIDKILGTIPEVKNRLLVVQVGDTTYDKAHLIPWDQRPRCDVILPGIQKKLEDVTGVRAIARCPSRSLVGKGSDESLEFVLLTNSSFKDLKKVASRVRRLIAQDPGIIPHRVDWDLTAEGPEFSVVVDRDRAASMGVSPQTIATALDIMVSGRRFTNFEHEGKQYPVRVWMKELYRKTPQDLLGLSVKGRREGKELLVPLVDLIKIEEKVSLPAINHYHNMRSVKIYGAVKSGQGLNRVYERLKPQIKEILPPSFRLSEGGEIKRFLSEKKTIFLVFALALAFIFLVMAAQFESFRAPFIIMLSVPLALMGAIVTLWIIPGGSLNIYSQIGLVTLIGLITKHGILMVDFANQLQKEGKGIEEAIVLASRLRLRPILMTTFAMVLGALPLALGSGPGFEGRRQIGWVIVGGMTLGTFFTLLMIPVVYTFLARRYRKVDLLV